MRHLKSVELIMANKETAIKHSIILFTFLLIFWGCYRLIFQLPDTVEELVIKPIVWLLPVVYFIRRERLGADSVGITTKNMFQAIYMALALGSLFAIEGILVNYLKYGELHFNANLGTSNIITSLGISFATAISEEIVFRGFLFSRMWQGLNNEWQANVVVSLGWVLIHVPITIFVLKLAAPAAISYLFLTFIFGLGSSFLYAKTKNISSSIFLHVLWEWPIILFR